uniref:Uncharacterized protein n=1 Tax=Candidatus Kentrum sp. DK TaxID=2126562 RepID=A0A450TFE3_9GAMM|nr:MAG: hypothetical protein BECKDK2373C_GA0170839_113711 [Candidatus Kentron sp. DK]
MKGPTRRPASFSMIATVCLLCFLTVSPAFAVDQQRSGAAIASFGDSSPNHLRHAQRKWNTRSGAISQCCRNLPQAKSFSLELSGAGHKNAPSRSGCSSPSSLGFGFIGGGGVVNDYTATDGYRATISRRVTEHLFDVSLLHGIEIVRYLELSHHKANAFLPGTAAPKSPGLWLRYTG